MSKEQKSLNSEAVDVVRELTELRDILLSISRAAARSSMGAQKKLGTEPRTLSFSRDAASHPRLQWFRETEPLREQHARLMSRSGHFASLAQRCDYFLTSLESLRRDINVALRIRSKKSVLEEMKEAGI